MECQDQIWKDQVDVAEFPTRTRLCPDSEWRRAAVNLLRFNRRRVFYTAIGLCFLLTLKFWPWEMSRQNQSCSSLVQEPSTQYAVFACSTPKKDSHRGFDYAFYLPLTVLAWERVGFVSIVLIIGSRRQWEVTAPLALVLSELQQLEKRRVASVIFIEAADEHLTMLAQVSRLFVANLDHFPGNDSDYIMTTDADLWPLRREHFSAKVNKQLVLVHSQCCGGFFWNGTEYQMYPMSNIGASAGTWKQVINDDHRWANDSQTMVSYFEDIFGPGVRQQVEFASENWYMDQKLVSIRIRQWMDLYPELCVHLVSDLGFSRIDRSYWDAPQMSRTQFEKKYDSHLPIDPTNPTNWETLVPLLQLMYNNNMQIIDEASRYALQFQQLLAEIRKSS